MKFSVKQLAKMAGVSARTLHYYDQMGLLKPMSRTDSGYRYYGEKELYRLQQILFYRELDFELKAIAEVLENPDFDIVVTLYEQREALVKKRIRLETIISTVDKTIQNLKQKNKMLDPKELYEGLSPETAAEYRKEAIDKYGKKAVETSENYLSKLTKDQINRLKLEQVELTKKLSQSTHLEIESKEVQDLIKQHYTLIRKFWGTDGQTDPQFDAYTGLGKLFVDDERFTMVDGKANLEFANWLHEAMRYFALHNLQ